MEKKYEFTSDMHRQSLNFSSWELSEANGDNFENVSLTHSRFHNCIFNKVNFRRAAVTGSIFEGCKFNECNFDDADFEFCEFRSCEINIRRIDGCSFNNSNFIKSILDDIDFIGCTFTGTFFNESEIKKVKIQFCTLEGACLRECNFVNLDWRELNLEYAEFEIPRMKNVVLPFFQIPYIFGILDYIANTADEVYISHGSDNMSVDDYFSYGIPFLIKEYQDKELYFPLSNIYLNGRSRDCDKALECLSNEIYMLSMVRDFRNIKFCCKLISQCPTIDKRQLNKIYKIIVDTDMSFNQNSAEMKSFTRNIGEIRNILFSRKKDPCLTINILTNIGIENSFRFANLLNQFQKLAKPNHTGKILASFTLSYNSPLQIEVNIQGDITLFSDILNSFLILTGIPLDECYLYPLVKSLKASRTENPSELNDILTLACEYRNSLLEAGINLIITEYYVKDCDEIFALGESKYFISADQLAII